MSSPNRVEDVVIRRRTKTERAVHADDSGLLAAEENRAALSVRIRYKLQALGFTDDEITLILDQ